MSDISMDRLDEWLHPHDFEMSQHATSIEEYDFLRNNATDIRARFVLAAAQAAIGEKTAETVEPIEDDKKFFASLPAVDFMTHRQFESLKYLAASMQDQYMSRLDLARYWHELTELQSILDGFPPQRLKYNDHFYRSDEAFAEALDLADEVRDSGYPVRFLMRGAKYVTQAALDLGTMRDWVEGRSTFDPDVYLQKRLSGEHPDRFLQSSKAASLHELIGWSFVRDHMNYWGGMIAVIDIARKNMPGFEQPKVFADCVEELAPGVYSAPYIPDEVAGSVHFTDHDDVHRTAVSEGHTDKATVLTFNQVAETAIALSNGGDWRTANRTVGWHTGKIHSKYDSTPGLLFMSRDTVRQAVEHIDKTRPKQLAVRNLGNALLNYTGNPFDQFTDLELKILD